MNMTRLMKDSGKQITSIMGLVGDILDSTQEIRTKDDRIMVTRLAHSVSPIGTNLDQSLTDEAAIRNLEAIGFDISYSDEGAMQCLLEKMHGSRILALMAPADRCEVLDFPYGNVRLTGMHAPKVVGIYDFKEQRFGYWELPGWIIKEVAPFDGCPYHYFLARDTNDDGITYHIYPTSDAEREYLASGFSMGHTPKQMHAMMSRSSL